MKDMYESAGQFTTNMLNQFWITNYEEDEDYDQIIDYLNKAENFRTFDDGLTEFIKKHGYVEDDSLDKESLIKQKTEFLYGRFVEKNIDITKATLENYFSGETRPDSKKRN
ncbi:MAG: hypothetical protein Q4E31_12985, partial [Intestinibacter bartlettii]